MAARILEVCDAVVAKLVAGNQPGDAAALLWDDARGRWVETGRAITAGPGGKPGPTLTLTATDPAAGATLYGRYVMVPPGCSVRRILLALSATGNASGAPAGAPAAGSATVRLRGFDGDTPYPTLAVTAAMPYGRVATAEFPPWQYPILAPDAGGLFRVEIDTPAGWNGQGQDLTATVETWG